MDILKASTDWAKSEVFSTNYIYRKTDLESKFDYYYCHVDCDFIN